MLRISLLFFIATLLVSCNLSDNRHAQPTGLMVEMLRQPDRALIEDAEPEFSWIVASEKSGDSQIAFQIFVASSRNKAELDQGDYWDSGKIQSAQSINVPYNGEPLKPNTEYFWKVRVWYNDNSVSSYSDIQAFKTGNFTETYQTSVEPVLQTVVMPQNAYRRADGNIFVDFAKSAFGSLRLQIKSTGADSVVFHLGEMKNIGDSVNRKPAGTLAYQRIVLPLKRGNRWCTLQIPPQSYQQVQGSVDMPAHIGEVMPFRFCEIENTSAEINLESFEQLVAHYPWDETQSYFSSSDTVLNQIWALSKYSVKATSFTGVYIDGNRERKPYEADALINQLSHYAVDRDYSLARFSHEYLIKNPTWPTEWIMQSVIMAWFDYLYTGNLESLRFYYNDLKEKTLFRLGREDGLISTKSKLMTNEMLAKIYRSEPLVDIVDWPKNERDGNEMPEINTVVNAYHCYSLQLFAKMAEALSYPDDAEFFSQRALKVRRSFNAKLFNEQTGLYTDGEGSLHSSLHANMFPLLFGLAEPQKQQPILDFIVSKKMACSPYGSQFLLDVLFLFGRDREALKLLTDTGQKSWWNMIRIGSTITTEAWDFDLKPNMDWSHAWGAVPANVVARGLWGFEPLLPGFEKIRIKPQTGGLTTAQIKFPTIRGAVEASFDTDERLYFQMKVNIPANMIAEVYLPTKNIGNPKLYIGDQIVDIRPEKGWFKLDLNSGRYTITVKHNK